MNITIQRTDVAPHGEVWDVMQESKETEFFPAETEWLGSFVWTENRDGSGSALISLPGVSTRIEMTFSSPRHAGEYIADGKARRVIRAAIQQAMSIDQEVRNDN